MSKSFMMMAIQVAVGFEQIAFSQTMDVIKDKLATVAVIRHEGKIYAKSAGVLRGTRESTEAMLGTRSTRLIANQLCGFEPVTGRRLEAKLTGVSMFSSSMVGTEIQVIMSAPEQTPACQVVTIPVTESSKPSPVESNLSNSTSSTKNNESLNSSDVKPLPASDITIRNFGNEY